MKTRVALLGILLMAVLLFVLLSYKGKEDYAVEIAGEKISFGEYMIYLYEQKLMFESIGGEDIWETDFDGLPAEDFAKQKAIDSLLYVLLAARQAESRGLKLTEEETAETEAQAKALLAAAKDYYPFTLEEAGSVMRQMKLFEKIYQEITAAVETESQDLKKQFYDSNFEKWRENLIIKKNDEWISGIYVKKPVYD